MKKRKFLLLIIGACLASPAIAGGRTTPRLGQLPLSETNMRSAHCDGADKSDLSLALIESEQKENGKKGAARTAKD